MTNINDDAALFWDLYFRNLFVRLERSGKGYRGEAYADPASAKPPAGFFRERKLRTVEIRMDHLRDYDYRSDGRFALILERPSGIRAALDAVIEKRYPYRDPAPFGKERMAELCTALRDRIGDGSLSAAERLLLRMIAEHTPALDQPIAALVWLVGEQRQKGSAPVLLSVLRNSSYWPFAEHRLHFTPVDAAFSALWKIDEKGITGELLEFMRMTSESGQRKIAALFERLLSTAELLSLDKLGERYLDPEFWADAIGNVLGASPLDRDRRDADALFWEIRLLAAQRLPRSETAVLEKLSLDEVGIVRDAARVHIERR